MRFPSLITNIFLATVVILTLILFARFSPVPTPMRAFGWLSFVTLFCVCMHRIFGPYRWARTPRATLAIIFGLFVVSSASAYRIISMSPFLSSRPSINLIAYAPIDAPEEWDMIPFYYALGAWPRRFLGEPIFHTLPYAKGPPLKFTSKIIARWHPPDFKVTFEGPASPPALVLPEHLSKCFINPWASEFTSPIECFQLRERALERHIQALHEDGYTLESVQWFEIENPNIPSTERARGLMMTAKRADTLQDRYVLVNPEGREQSIALERPNSEKGAQAQALFEKSLRSLRVLGDLASLRAQADRMLLDTRLDEAGSIAEPIDRADWIARVQARLISKISVEPKSHDAYYHLGGTAMMLAQHARKLQTLPNGTVNEPLALLAQDWLAAAKPLVKSAYLYAQDVDAKNPNTTRLEGLWLEIQKMQ